MEEAQPSSPPHASRGYSAFDVLRVEGHDLTRSSRPNDDSSTFLEVPLRGKEAGAAAPGRTLYGAR